jgi:hypothetical protein
VANEANEANEASVANPASHYIRVCWVILTMKCEHDRTRVQFLNLFPHVNVRKNAIARMPRAYLMNYCVF